MASNDRWQRHGKASAGRAAVGAASGREPSLEKHSRPEAAPTPSRPRRRLLGALALLLPLAACEALPRKVALDVVLFSYLDRPIFDVMLNGKWAGDSNGYPQTGGGTISGVEIPLGPQKLTWLLGGPKGKSKNGDTVTAKNSPLLESIPKNAQFLGVHIYANDTVELIPSIHYPDFSPRGQQYIEALKAFQK